MFWGSGVYGLARTPASGPITESTGKSYGSMASDLDPSSMRNYARSIAWDRSARSPGENGTQYVLNDSDAWRATSAPGQDNAKRLSAPVRATLRSGPGLSWSFSVDESSAFSSVSGRSRDSPGRIRIIAPSGFEPLSPAPKASMLGHYTTGLRPDAPWGDTKSSSQSTGRGPPRAGTMANSVRGREQRLRRTRILATLGPASSSPRTLRSLLEAGADGFRVNFSHGTPDEQRQLIRRGRAASRSLHRDVAIMADLQGPKIRLGAVANDSVMLTEGQRVRLDGRAIRGGVDRLPVQMPRLGSAARRGDPILLGDGGIELRVEGTGSNTIVTRVIRGGAVHSHQGIYLPRARLRRSVLGSKDLDDLDLALKEQVDFVALSFVSSAADVRRARRFIAERTVGPVGIVAKIERAAALDSIEGILRESDGIMVARGDLGIEVPLERLALEQKRLVTLGQRAGKQTIVATQMLISMVSAPRPTRAEATDVANAILDGTDAVMLSEESAVGAFPVLAVAWMDRIARATEGAIDRERFRVSDPQSGARLTEEAVADAAVRTAETIGAGAIVVPTHSGRTARLVSRLRPAVPILALSRSRATRRKLALTWGVQTEPSPARLSLDQLRRLAERSCRRVYSLPPGCPIVMTAGYPVEGRPTNLVTVTVV